MKNAHARWLLLALVAVAYWPFAVAELFWDDRFVIRADGPIAHAETFARALTGRCVLFDGGIEYPYYRPLVDLLLLTEYRILYTHPFVYHLTNFLLHAANTLLAFTLFRAVRGRWREESQDEGGTLAIAGAIAVFALHPLQVESVLWPAARPAMLSLFLAQLGMWALLRLTREGTPAAHGRRALGAVLGYGASLLAKEVAVALPVALAPLLLAKDTRVPRRVALAAACCGAALMLYFLLNREVGGHAGRALFGAPLAVATACAEVFGFYLRKLFWPAPLYPYYAHGTHHEPILLVLGAIALAGSAVASLWLLRVRTWRACVALSGLVMFVGGALLPVLGGQLALADRYLYQALWGLGALLAVAPAPRAPAARAALAIVVAALTATTLAQSLRWRTERGLWEYTLTVDPSNIKALSNLGLLAEARGDFEEALRRHHAAAFTPRRSQREDDFAAALNAGRIALQLERYDVAVECYAFAERWPKFRSEARTNRALAEYLRGNADAARAILAETDVPPGTPLAVSLNRARMALRFEKDAAEAARWYRQYRERGGLPEPEFE